MVPDLICHKWFQGICGFGDRCWNQHGDTFDNAVALAIQTQQGLRRHVAPFLYDPADGGTIRQIDRDEARRVICATILRYRMSTIRKWYFGTSWTTYYEYQSFARSDLARQLREAGKARRATLRDRSPTGRGRASSPRRADTRVPSRPGYSWTNRRSATPTRSSFPSARSATPPPTRTAAPSTRPFFDAPSMETESDGSSAPRFGAPGSSSRPGDVGNRGRATPTVAPTARGQSPTQQWLDRPHTTPMIVESMTTTQSRPQRQRLTECPTMMICGLPSGPKSRNLDQLNKNHSTPGQKSMSGSTGISLSPRGRLPVRLHNPGPARWSRSRPCPSSPRSRSTSTRSGIRLSL